MYNSVSLDERGCLKPHRVIIGGHKHRLEDQAFIVASQGSVHMAHRERKLCSSCPVAVVDSRSWLAKNVDSMSCPLVNTTI